MDRYPFEQKLIDIGFADLGAGVIIHYDEGHFRVLRRVDKATEIDCVTFEECCSVPIDGHTIGEMVDCSANPFALMLDAEQPEPDWILRGLRTQIEQVDIDAVSVLLPHVIKTESAITYGDLSKKIEQETGRHYDPHVGFSTSLGRIQSVCDELSLPCLSVMVVNQKWQPGTGFVSYYKKLHPERASWSDKGIRLEELNSVKKCKDWSRLFRFYGIDTTQEEIQSNQDAQRYVEGAKNTLRKLSKESERSPQARLQCLELFGPACAICGFNSEEQYGIPGIIHVHHLRPLADGGERETDPEKDLVPVCPNCHAIIHSKSDGCYTPDEVREMLAIKKPVDKDSSR